MPHNVIIGGGISGLSLAYRLKRSGASVTLLEATDRVGGCIRTDSTHGYLFEYGPRSLRPDNTVQQLIDDLGIASDVVLADKTAKRRFIFHKGRLTSATTGFIPTILQAAAKDLFAKPGLEDDESIYDFGVRRFGKAFTNTLLDALTAGIYAGDTKELSLKSCFPSFARADKQGSLIKQLITASLSDKSAAPIYSFKNGIQTLSDTLAAAVRDEIHLSAPVDKITVSQDKITVHYNNDSVDADHLFLALPPQHMASLLPTLQLPPLPTRTLATIHIGFQKEVLPKKGFGYLVPREENEPILGVVFDSSTFPQQNRHTNETRITVMTDRTPDDTLVQRVLQNHLGINERPDVIVYSTAPAIPQYTVGHAARIAKLTHDLSRISPRLSLLGAATHGLSVNECIKTAFAIKV